MYITADYLKTDPWTAVIEMINNEYGTELSPYTAHLVSLESLGGTKTKIKIRTNISTSPDNTMPVVELPEFIYYDRLDLGKFFKGGPLYVMDNVRLPLTTYDIMSLLDTKNDITFSCTDLVPAAFDTFNKAYQLNAAANSLRFVGSINFNFANSLKYDLTAPPLVTAFPKVNTWQLGNKGLKITGNYLFTGYDFTSYRDDIRPVKTNGGFANIQRLRGMIKTVTGQDWVVQDATTVNNLCHSIYEGGPRVRVVYNGVRDPAYTPRTDISYVMVLELSETRCSNVSGFLLLHYN